VVGAQNLDALTLYDLYFHYSPPRIRDSSTSISRAHETADHLVPNCCPGLYLGTNPDLSPRRDLRVAPADEDAFYI
jgi:hypothetical protein